MTSAQEPFPVSIQRLRGAFGALGRAMLDLLLPIACGGCGREGDLFCSACRASTPMMPAPRCPHCDRPLPAGDARCFQCARRPLRHLAGLRTDYAYTGPLRRAILALKYHSLHALAEPLGELLVATWERRRLSVDLVVPIPLHQRRERSRGFNQAALLSQLVASDCGIPIAADGLVRLRDTPPQARAANEQARQAQVAGAFAARSDMAGQTVLLVDDVCTTGATLDAAALACHAAGARQVWGLVLARTL